MRKRIIGLALLLIVGLVGCSENDNNEENKNETISNNNVLIAYFTLQGNTDVDTDTTSSASISDNNSQTGTTEIVANTIQQSVGGNMLSIKMVTPYPEDYDATIEQSRSERTQDQLIAIEAVPNLDQYDVIFLGYPIWGTTIPGAIETFLSENDLSDKTIIPFCTHAGYGSGSSYEAIGELAPNATILDGLELDESDVASSEDEIEEWIDGLDIEFDTNHSSNMSNISIQMEDISLEAEIYDSALAQEIMRQLPIQVEMGRYGNREYYGPLDFSVENEGEGQRTFEDGHLTYCPTNNSIAIFFAQSDRPNLTMDVIPIGKVTSDLSVFDDMNDNVTMNFQREN